MRLTGGKLYGRFHYTEDRSTWKIWDAPVFNLLPNAQGQTILIDNQG